MKKIIPEPTRSKIPGLHKLRYVTTDYVLPSAMFFVIGRALILIVAMIQHVSSFNQSVLNYGDSAFYLQISKQGYIFSRCSDAHSLYCGNTGWQPLYPYLIRVFTWFGFSSFVASIIISLLFYLGVLSLLYYILKKSKSITKTKRYLLMTAAAFFPGMVYFYTIYPLSMLMFLLLVIYLLLANKSSIPKKYVPTILVLAAFATPLAYSSAIAIVPIVGAWYMLMYLRDKVKAKEQLLPATVTIVSAILGYCTFLLILQLSTGTWRAQNLVQKKYGVGIHDPIKVLLQQLIPTHGLNYFSQTNVVAGIGDLVVAIQSAVVLFFIALLVYAAYKYNNKFSDFDWLLFVSTIIFWLLPLVLGPDVSSYRSDATLLPGLILLRFLPEKMLTVLGVMFLVTTYLLTKAVLLHRLI